MSNLSSSSTRVLQGMLYNSINIINIGTILKPRLINVHMGLLMCIWAHMA